jgi:hypothetical protein
MKVLNWRQRVNTIVVILGGLSLLNMVLTSFDYYFFQVAKHIEILLYDISRGLFSGSFLYILTSAIPIAIKRYNNRKLYRNEAQKFIEKSISRLESIKAIDYSLDKDALRSAFKELNYGHLVQPKSSNTIYLVLTKIFEEKESLYRTCMPYSIAANDYDNWDKMNKVINHKVFNSSREYTYKDKEDLKDTPVGIGAYIKQLYDELTTLQKILNE